MPKAHSSRKGSLAFRPRKRASTHNGRIRNWPSYSKPGLLGFVGYKAGMLHIMYNETHPTSPNKGKEVRVAGTLIETPPLLIYGVRVYKRTPYGRKLVGDFFAKDSNVLKRARITKAKSKTIDELDNHKGNVCELRVLALTNPSLTTTGKKRAERVELGVGGSKIDEMIEYVKQVVGKELNIGDVLNKGDYVDVVAVTKGKGWQGVVKRFGVAIQRRKATGVRRHVGNLGSWHPAVVEYTALQAGQMGYHKRTVLNNLVVDIGEGSDINQSAGLLHYGQVRTKYVIIKGSVPGAKKRMIKLRRALRKPNAKREMKVTYKSRVL